MRKLCRNAKFFCAQKRKLQSKNEQKLWKNQEKFAQKCAKTIVKKYNKKQLKKHLKNTLKNAQKCNKNDL